MKRRSAQALCWCLCFVLATPAAYAVWCTRTVECKNGNQLYSTQVCEYAGTCSAKTGGPWNCKAWNELISTCSYNCKDSGWWDVCCSEPSCSGKCGQTVSNECGYSRQCPACPCTPSKTCADYPGRCGTFSNGCTNSLSCGANPGETCTAGGYSVAAIPVMQVKCPGVATPVDIAGTVSNVPGTLKVKKGSTTYSVWLVNETDATKGSCAKTRISSVNYRLRKK